MEGIQRTTHSHWPIDFSQWVFILGSKAHSSQEFRTCRELLDFNMVAERELREIIAWDIWDVPIHREDLH